MNDDSSLVFGLDPLMSSMGAGTQSCAREQGFRCGEGLTPFIRGGITETSLAHSKDHHQAVWIN